MLSHIFIIFFFLTYSLGQTPSNSVDKEQIKAFSNLSKYYWDENGPLRGLRGMNSIRVPLVLSTLAGHDETPKRILDIGCGGGLLSEALGNAVAAQGNIQIIGIDPSNESIIVAQHHLPPNLKGIVSYICETIENYAHNDKDDDDATTKFDTVVISEVIEHVDHPEDFLRISLSQLKKGGSIILTTPAQTILSWLGFILYPEYISRQFPIGLHEYSKFIPPQVLREMLERNGCAVQKIQGGFYNPLNNTYMEVESIRDTFLAYYSCNAAVTKGYPTRPGI